MHDSIALLDLSHKENLDAIPPVPFVVSNNLKYIKNKKIKNLKPNKKKKKSTNHFFLFLERKVISPTSASYSLAYLYLYFGVTINLVFTF